MAFIIASLRQDGAHYRLDLEFQDNGSPEPDLLSKHWLRLDVHERDLTSLMDINVADIQGGLSYHIGIAAANGIDESRLPTHYVDFANNITLNLTLARDFNGPLKEHPFFNWPRKADRSPTVPLVAMTQKRAWRFTMAGSDYVAEVAAFQDVHKKPNGYHPRAYEMRWGVQLWHQLWDLWLPGNKDLAIGQRASWQAEEWFLFPTDKQPTAQQAKEKNSGNAKGEEGVEDMFFYAGDGFRTLMEKLECLERIGMGYEEGKGGEEDEAPIKNVFASGESSDED